MTIIFWPILKDTPPNPSYVSNLEYLTFLLFVTEEDRVPLHNYLELGLDGLVKETNFTREEIQRMYRGFKQVNY